MLVMTVDIYDNEEIGRDKLVSYIILNKLVHHYKNLRMDFWTVSPLGYLWDVTIYTGACNARLYHEIN